MEKQSNRFTAAILITSDRAAIGTRPDETGPLLKQYLSKLGFKVEDPVVVPDDKTEITAFLRKWINQKKINLILISGGTGLAPRDVTPEATLEVIEKRIPGMEEAMRRISTERTPYGMLSRSVVGIAGRSLIVDLPGSPRGAVENLEVIAPALWHALQLISGEHPDP